MRKPITWSSSSVSVDWYFVSGLKEGLLLFDDGSRLPIDSSSPTYPIPEKATSVTLYFLIGGGYRYAGSARKTDFDDLGDTLQEIQPIKAEKKPSVSVPAEKEKPSVPKAETKKAPLKEETRKEAQEMEWAMKVQKVQKDFQDRLERRIQDAVRE